MMELLEIIQTHTGYSVEIDFWLFIIILIILGR